MASARVKFARVQSAANTISSRITRSTSISQSSTGAAPRAITLDEAAKSDDLVRMEQIFEEADEDGGGGLDIDEFKGAMQKVLGGRLDDTELARLFMKVDTNCDGTVDWDEFLSFTLLKYQEKDLIKSLLAEIPFERDPVYVAHCGPIIKSLFVQHVNNRMQVCRPLKKGRFFTLEHDGILRIWSQSFSFTRQCQLEGLRKGADLFCTDIVAMLNCNLVVVSTTANQLIFYDMNKLDVQFAIFDLRNNAETLDYWFDEYESKSGLLVWGDSGGAVYTCHFPDLTRIGANCQLPLHHFTTGRANQAIINRGSIVHPDWVKRVLYIQAHASVISCCRAPTYSIVVRPVEPGASRTTYIFDVFKGISDIAYSEDFNAIISAGGDHNVKIWDPYIPNQPINILTGHSHRVVKVFFDTITDHIISYSSDYYVKVWSFLDSTCLQTFYAYYRQFQPYGINTVDFHPVAGKLIFAHKEVMYRSRTGNVSRKVHHYRSHSQPVSRAIYNPLFDCVVSADEASTISVWNLQNGEKTMQFTLCHRKIEKGQIRPLEITAMTFDPTYRRLYTASKKGEVKCWNFNNGQCLQEYSTADDDSELCAILYSRNRIYAAGWDRQVHVIVDAKSDDDYSVSAWNIRHVDDIEAICQYGPFMVTGDCDGDIVFWQQDTGQFSFRFNINESIRAIRSPQTALNDIINEEKRSRSRASVNTSRSARSELFSRLSRYSSRLNRQRVRTSLSRANTSTSNESHRVKFRGDATSAKKVIRPVEEIYSPITALLALHARCSEQTTAVIISSSGLGWVHGWSISVDSKLAGHFLAANKDMVSINCLATDDANIILVTGDGDGYIRVWDLTSFCAGSLETSRVESLDDKGYNFPLRNHLVKVVDENRSIQPPQPLARVDPCSCPLLSSFKGHSGPVVSLDLYSEKQLIISASVDCSVRLFTFSGKFLGLFGQEKLWRLPRLLQTNSRGSIPNDLKRGCSPMSSLSMRGKKMKNHWAILRYLVRSQSKVGNHHSSSESESSESSESVEDSELLQQILDDDDFSFSLRSDILQGSFKERKRISRLQYLDGVKPREYNKYTVDAFHSLHTTSVEQLPKFQQPSFVQEVIAKMDADKELDKSQFLRERVRMARVKFARRSPSRRSSLISSLR